MKSTDKLSARCLPVTELGQAERVAWNALCRETPGLGSPFYSYGYAWAVAECRPDVRVCVLMRRDQPVGFLPFQFAGSWQRLLGAAEPVGGTLTDYFGPVTTADLWIEPRELLRLAGLSSLLFSHLDESRCARGLTGEAPEPGLRIDLAAGAAAYWQALRSSDKALLTDTERRRRRLIEQYGPLHLELEVADPGPVLEHLIEHKRRQYARTGTVDVLAPAWTRAVLHRLAMTADPLCRGVVSVLTAGDTQVAAHFGLRCGGTLHYWFPVYNTELSRFSPGRLLLAAIIDAACTDGITMIDRGAGDAPAKLDFANARHVYYRGLWSTSDARALCFRAAMSARWRLAAVGSGGTTPC
ncbi:MAG: GNAT family N-acetyltransferase [Rhodospirillaceae bacterium]